MQNNKAIIFIFLSFFFSTSAVSAKKSSPDKALTVADSLFKEKKFLEAAKIYDRLMLQQNYISPKAALRSAYIKEGAGKPAQALYYLSLYHLFFPNEAVKNKIHRMAKNHEFSGYEYGARELMVEYYNRYYDYLSFALLGIGALFALYLILFVKPRFRFVHGLFIVYMFGLYFGLSQEFTIYSKGIVIAERAPLMDGPSAAAGFLGKAKTGQKVAILKKEGLWYKVMYEGKERYIAKKHIGSLVRKVR